MYYLGSKIEPEVAVVRQSVLDEKRHLVAQAELDLRTESTSLAEVDQVLEGEGKGDRLAEIDFDVLGFVVDVGVWAQGHRAGPDVSAAGELDTLFRGLDRD